MHDLFEVGKKKVIAIVVSSIVSVALFISPVLIGAAAVAIPVVAVADFFQGIGDFLFGVNDDENEVIQLMNKLFENDKDAYKDKYESYILKDEITIPYEYLIVVNTLIGKELEDISLDMLEYQHICALVEIDGDKTVIATPSKYITCLKESEPWFTGFGDVSTTTIEGYINYYTNLFQLGSLDEDFLSGLDDSEFVYPLKEKAVVTSEFGGRNLGPIGGVDVSFHTGIDLAYNGGEAATCGRAVYAVMGGTVTKTQNTVGQAGANWGEISQGEISQWYLHLNAPFLYNVGDKVKKGDMIGYIGSTGLSSACHLHLEFRKNGQAINPRNFMEFDNPKLVLNSQNKLVINEIKYYVIPKEDYMDNLSM